MLLYTKTSKLHLLPGAVILLGILLASALFSPVEHSFAARAATCASASSTFDATSATSDQLKQYGLPPRPDATNQPNAYSAWQTIVSTAKTRHCNTTTTSTTASGAKAVQASAQSQASQMRPLASSKSLGGQGSDQSTDNTAGYQTDGYNTNVTEVVGTFKAPRARDSNAGELFTLIDFGFGNITMAMGLYSDQNGNYFWYQDPSGAVYQDTQTVRAGDSITVLIGYDPSTQTISASDTDTTTSTFFSPSGTISGRPATNAAWVSQSIASSPILNFETIEWNGVTMGHDGGDIQPLSWLNYHRLLCYNSQGTKLMDASSSLDASGEYFQTLWLAAS